MSSTSLTLPKSNHDNPTFLSLKNEIVQSLSQMPLTSDQLSKLCKLQNTDTRRNSWLKSNVTGPYHDVTLNTFKLYLYHWSLQLTKQHYEEDNFCHLYCIGRNDPSCGCSAGSDCIYVHSVSCYSLMAQGDFAFARLLCEYFIYRQIHLDNPVLWCNYACCLYRTVPKHCKPSGASGASGDAQKVLERSEACFLRSLGLDEAHSETHSNFALLLTDLGHLERAEMHHLRALQIRPYSARANYSFGAFLAYGRGKFKEGLKYVNRACKLEPRDTDFEFDKAQILHRLERFAEAIGAFDKAMFLHESGGKKLSRRDLETAKKCKYAMSTVLRGGRKNWDAGIVAQWKDGVAQLVADAREDDKKTPRVQGMEPKGNAKSEMGWRESMIEPFVSGMSDFCKDYCVAWDDYEYGCKRGDYCNLSHNVCLSELILGNENKRNHVMARVICEYLVSLPQFCDNPVLLHWHAYLLQISGEGDADYLASERCYLACLDANEKYAQAHFNYATLLETKLTRARRNKKVEYHFRRALQLNPCHAERHHAFGRFLRLRGRAAESLDYVENACKLDDENCRYVYEKARVLYELKEGMQSIVAFEKALSLHYTSDCANLKLTHEQVVHARIWKSEMKNLIRDRIVNSVSSDICNICGKNSNGIAAHAWETGVGTNCGHEKGSDVESSEMVETTESSCVSRMNEAESESSVCNAEEYNDV